MVDHNYTKSDPTSVQENRFDDQHHFEVKLKIPLRGIAPGQICAVYFGGKAGDLICLGGGPIDHTGQNYWEMQQDLPNTLHPSGHNDTSVIQTRKREGN